MADLRLSGIERRYGSVPVLHGIDLAVADGEFVVIVGPSGCGKSTLLRIIAGLETMNGGRVEIAGADVSQRSPAQRGIAMVFQTYALYPHKTVFDNMGYGLKLAGRPRAEIRDKVSAVARVLELEPYLQRKPSALSGGQRQRVAIGRAIVRDPKVFLFDEPLSNLDAALRGQMRVEIADLHARLAATMIYVTHDQVEAMTMADRIVILNEGRIEQQGAPLELYHNPVNLFVASFLGAPRMNLLTATVTAVAVDCVTLELAGGDRIELAVEAGGLKVGDAATLGLRPHDLATSPGVHGLAVEVSLVEPLGGQTIVYGSAAGARVTVALPGDAAIQPRTSVRFSFDAADCHLFNADGVACRRLAAPHPTPQPV